MSLRSFLTILVAFLAAISWGSPSAGIAQTRKRALFEISIAGSSFTIALKERRSIAQARRILRKKAYGFVTGSVVPTRARYNKGWSFHLAPKSIQFVQASIGTCDASPEAVEKSLAVSGDTMLPGGFWCPWGAELTREISPAAARRR